MSFHFQELGKRPDGLPKETLWPDWFVQFTHDASDFDIEEFVTNAIAPEGKRAYVLQRYDATPEELENYQKLERFELIPDGSPVHPHEANGTFSPVEYAPRRQL